MRELALVTGGAGFIGRHLVGQLVASGTEVRVLDVARRPPTFPDSVSYTRGTVLDHMQLAALMDGVQELYHLAAIAHLWVEDPRRYRQINVEGTRRVLDAAVNARVRRIVVTSTETILRGWRDPNPAPVTEQDRPPRRGELPGPYSISKAAAHAIARRQADAGAPIAIVYPTVPVGPGDDTFTAPTAMIRDFVNGKTPAFLESGLNLVPVEDVARGHILAARRGEPRGRYLLGGETLQLSELVAMLEDLTGHRMPRKTVPFWLALAAGHVATAAADALTHKAPAAPLEGVRLAKITRKVDSSHARQTLGWRAGPVEQAVGRCVEWLEAHGHIRPSLESAPARIALRLEMDAPTPDGREARLGAALRSNLRRRKAQARQQAAGSEDDDEPTSPGGAS